MTKPFYITTPIYYVNGAPHLGHAYCTVACDVMARFKRLDGYDVRFLTGTDEHGIKVFQAARDQGVTPQALCDRYSQQFKDVLPLLNISNDDFIRTTDERHKKGAQAFWQKLMDAGQIYKGGYSGWYAVRDEAYYAEDELSVNEKGEKIATATGAPVEWMEEESYFFKLSEWGDKLLAFYDANPDFMFPEATRKEVISFVKSGLKDLSISRTTFDWGIPVPNDPKHVMYVWIDALTNYITALGYPEYTDGMVDKFWPGINVVGKEITRFHCVYWPAFLMAADLLPPERVVANGWWVVDGQKMSKSLGNVLAPQDMVAKYGLDPLRFALLDMVSFGSDGNFAHDRAVSSINAFCANGLGNLAQRTLSFIQKNAGAVVPQGKPLDRRFIDDMRTHMDAFSYDKALDVLRQEINFYNQYIDQNAPWTLRKEGKMEEMETVLYAICEGVRNIAIALQPFMPETMGKMLDQLAVPADERTLGHISPEFALKPGTPLPMPEGLFPRLDQ